MRRTIESVAAERLNKLGKNPSIISTRHDLKRDAAVLKDIIDRATPQPSSEEDNQSSSSSLSSNENKSKYLLKNQSDEENDSQNNLTLYGRLPEERSNKLSFYIFFIV